MKIQPLLMSSARDVEALTVTVKSFWMHMNLHAAVFPLKLGLMCVRSEAQKCWTSCSIVSWEGKALPKAELLLIMACNQTPVTGDESTITIAQVHQTASTMTLKGIQQQPKHSVQVQYEILALILSWDKENHLKIRCSEMKKHCKHLQGSGNLVSPAHCNLLNQLTVCQYIYLHTLQNNNDFVAFY